MGVAVAVLNPQDCLKQPFSPKALISPSPSQSKHHRNLNNSNRANRRGRRIPNRSGEKAAAVEKPAGRLVNGAVKILKRGVDLRETTPEPPTAPAAEGLLGAGPEPAREQIRVRIGGMSRADGFYAGSSACIVSPPPSSLPLPAFFARKSDASPTSNNSEATSVLMKILRLDLQ